MFFCFSLLVLLVVCCQKTIFTATVNVAISKISSVTNITTLVPYLVRILGGPLPRCSNNLILMPILK